MATVRLDVAEIRRRVDAIRASMRDNERAHDLEDDLYRDVLWTIAIGAPNAAELANAALLAAEIDYQRWYA